MASGEAQPSGLQQLDLTVYPLQPKRVNRACDSCRKKRIKCSAGQRPCMNCLLYHSTCTDSPLIAPTRVHKSRRAQPSASHQSRQIREQELEGLLEGVGESPESPRSRPTPTVISLEENIGMQHVRHGHDVEGADELLPSGPDQTPRSSGLLSSSDPWDPNLYMPNIFDFADSPSISDLPTNFSQFNPSFLTRERLLTPCGSKDIHGGTRPITPSTRQPKVAGVHFLKDGLPSREFPSLLPGLFLKKDACESRYQGLNSIGATLSSCLVYAKNHSPEFGEHSLLQYLIQGITYMDEANRCTAPNIDPQDLPERSFVEFGVESFFKSVYLRYPIVSLELKTSWTRWYDGSSGPPDPIQFLCISIMTAIGATVHPSGPTEEMQTKIFALHQRAWSMMDYVLAYPYTGSVQVILLHTLFFTQQGKLGIAWSTCGTALRMAESIGLHRHTPGDLQLNDELVRLRARLWWVAYSLDAFLSLCEGRPTGTSIDKTDAKIEPLTPQECPDDYELVPGPMIYAWHVTLACIVNQVADIIGREKATNECLHYLAELDMKFIAWRDEIPLEFRPEQENLAPSQLQHHVSWLHVQFFNALRTLHWTSMLLTHRRDERFPTDRYLRLRSSEAICVASTRSLIRTSNSRSDISDNRDIPSAYFLAATSTIFMHILKEPKRLSAKADVEYLRAGIHHLTSEFFAAQVGQGQKILLQMLQIAETATHPLKCINNRLNV